MKAADKLNWWREARFGLFIHWGLYSIPAGIWKGREVPGIGEQILRFAEIPMSEYEKLAAEFNPIKFDADAVVQLAVDAGMKYLVITAKHHDGFALFKSDVDPFNIVDATPFGRDIVQELAAACEAAGIKFCIYYSQRQDWHHPDGSWNEWANQHPVPVDEREVDFNRCMEEKCIPQMKELLTEYGPIGLVWYDTAVDSTPAQSRAFAELVHRRQPGCLVCDRVGNGYGDYAVLGDNEFPYCSRNMDGEVPATMNHSWGYKRTDYNWKSVDQLLYSLIRSASNGCNYLLNIGPKADGTVPSESVERLQAMGRWMRTNGEAIYGAGAAPFPNPFPWGMMTVKDHFLYLIFSKWPGSSFRLQGLKNQVVEATVLAEPGRKVKKEQEWDEGDRVKNSLQLDNLPEHAPDSFFSVVRLELAGIPAAEQELVQAEDGTVSLLTGNAKVHRVNGSRLSVDRKGLPISFHEGSGSLRWKFGMSQSGRYRIDALTNRHWSHEWIAGVQVEITVNGESITAALMPDVVLENIQSKYHPETISHLGTTCFLEPGVYDVEISVTAMPVFEAADPLCEDLEENRTLNLIELRLVPENG
ncbi:MAG: alpha-L-fucosidase [Verrucomicrobia bacterium]|nr:alpha-L-fucosidase [Verrucomicrobiota bacterium]